MNKESKYSPNRVVTTLGIVLGLPATAQASDMGLIMMPYLLVEAVLALVLTLAVCRLLNAHQPHYQPRPWKGGIFLLIFLAVVTMLHPYGELVTDTLLRLAGFSPSP